MRISKLVVPFLALFVAWTPAQAAEPAPLTITGATTIDATQAKEMFDRGAVIIDVRGDTDYDAGRIPGAVHLDVKTKLSAEELLKVVQRDQEVVMYCNGEKCGRSSKACAMAVAWGFTNVHYFRAGFPAWQKAGHPVE